MRVNSLGHQLAISLGHQLAISLGHQLAIIPRFGDDSLPLRLSIPNLKSKYAWDTLKTRLQADRGVYRNSLHCAVITIRKEGALALLTKLEINTVFI